MHGKANNNLQICRESMFALHEHAAWQATFTDLVRGCVWLSFTKHDLSPSHVVRNPLILRYPYVAMDPLLTAAAFCLASAGLCWVVSTATRNYSQVDRLWSILPCIYAWHFALRDLFHAMHFQNYHHALDVRTLLMAVLVTIWGSRLTYNFARKGGYKYGSEDYRWAALRGMMPSFAFQALNLVFNAAFQNLLLLAMTLPAYVSWRAKSYKPYITWLDVVATLMFLFFLGLETLADGQQWNFQLEKRQRVRAGIKLKGDYGDGFLQRGLFRYSRHPNFFAEMAIWWSFYLFSVSATENLFNWSIVGPLLLTLLFQGSTWFTEMISKRKYPRYAAYQKTTNRFVPLVPLRAIQTLPGRRRHTKVH